jgi:hypothetical protein
MLAQKDLAAKTGATFAFTLPAAPTDAKRAQDLLGDITAAEQELSRLEQEAAKYSGGLVQALAESNVAMQRQTIAMLKQATMAHTTASIGRRKHKPRGSDTSNQSARARRLGRLPNRPI